MIADLPKDLVGFLLIIPEISSSGDLLELIDVVQPLIDVKDTPVTVRAVDLSRAIALFLLQTW